MNGLRKIAAAIGIAAGVVMIAALIGAVMSIGAGETEACAFNLCFGERDARLMLGAAAISGLAALLFLSGKDAGGAAGAGVVILGLVAAASVAPEIRLATDGERLSQQAEAAISAAENTIFNEDSPVFEANVPLIEGGLAARRITIKGDQSIRLRIDVALDGEGDPLIELYREEGSDRRYRIATDDDGGGELKARIERQLEPGGYLLIMRDINDEAPFIGGVAFKLRISRVNLDEIIPETRRATLVLGESGAGCGDSARHCRLWPNETVALLDGQSDEDFYRLKLETQGQNACLIVDVHPIDGGDTSVGVFDINRELIGFNDDDDPEDFGSRIVIPIDADEQRHHDLLLHVGAYLFDVPTVRYSLYVELRARDAGDRCVTGSDFRRGEEI